MSIRCIISIWDRQCDVCVLLDEYYIAHDMEMSPCICGECANDKIACCFVALQHTECKQIEMETETFDFNEKGPIDFNGELNCAVSVATSYHITLSHPTDHQIHVLLLSLIVIRTGAQWQCLKTFAEWIKEINLYRVPSNKILWNWLL